jgi:hypothetical protein
MKSKEMALLVIAVAAIGIFALPSTVSLFAGQHTWYDLGAKGNDVPCEKCHADIADELGISGPHKNMSCWYCHRTGNLTGYTYASGDGTASTPGQEVHAASTVECMECHEGFGIGYPDLSSCTKCHWTPTPAHPTEWFDEPCGNCHVEYTGETHFTSVLEAGGFNLTINQNDTGSAAAHKAFVDDAINNSDIMGGANEACIACHTMIAVKINWTHARSMEFNVSIGDPMKTDVGVHNWTMANWAVNGTANATVWGNTTGAGHTSYWEEWPGNVDDIYR